MRVHRSGVLLIGMAMVLGACGNSDGGDAEAVVENYADLVHEAYSVSLASAETMDDAIAAFVADPSAATLDEARTAWLEARDDYGPTEVFRFYGGPIDNDETGPEGLLNAWPLDEAYIDYVEGVPDAGIVNDSTTFPVIDAEVLLALNEEGGETNISTGWHAIEFLLWGQDLAVDGPGDRPVEDYTTNPNAERRATYLTVASELLLTHLGEMVAAWAPDADNYRSEFLALPTDDALGHILTGVGEMSRGELAGERMSVAYEERSQEDEHSCFSDNTHNDIIGNALGVQAVLTGIYGSVEGPGVIDLVAAEDQELAGRLEAEMEASVAATRAIPAPFDQHLVEGVSDDDPGRASILAAIVSLETQADAIVAAADALGLTLNLS